MVNIIEKEGSLKKLSIKNMFNQNIKINSMLQKKYKDLADYSKINNLDLHKENKFSNYNKNMVKNNEIKVNEGYAIEIFNRILESAVCINASDIHIEPFEKDLVIRFRIEGSIKEYEKLNKDIYPYLSSIIKLKASMDITEKRLPQDGRVDISINNKSIDIRVSSIPTIYGEKIVLRLLNRSSFLKSKEQLGFSKNAINTINNIINKKSGIIIVTGSTGSGKTTTVYSILNELKNTNKNIITIEDPVEYKMHGINQISVNEKLGLGFENGLRSILRQDPDIIMIGEIRDVETAQIAIRAAITGHLVISTMHTNDAISSIARLIDMNIEPYLINASLIGVISQKLIKKSCIRCDKDFLIKDTIKYDLDYNQECIKCTLKENSNRAVIYEILEINDEIKMAIKDMTDINQLKEVSIENKMITFDESIKELA